MDDLWIMVVGMTAAVMTTASWVPQAIKSWRTRSANDFSWGYLLLFAAGVALWEVYGLLRHDPALIAANLLTFILVLGVMAIKISER